MRILLITGSPLLSWHGRYYAVDTWVKFPLHLAAHVDQLTLWTPVRPADPHRGPTGDAWAVELGRMVIEPNLAYNSFASYYRRNLTQFRRSNRAARELIERHDVVVIRLPSPMISLIARLCRRKKKPLIAMIGGDVGTTDRLLKSRGLRRLLYVAVSRSLVRRECRALRDARIIYAYNEELARRNRESSARVLPMRTPHLSLSDFRQREDTCKNHPFRLLRIGWFLPIKGNEHLLDAMAILTAKGLPVVLDLVGQERMVGYEQHLRAYAKKAGVLDCVTFRGWVPYPKMPEVYWTSDLQVICSLSEGTPRSIVEGASQGLPLVCTAAGGCPDVLSDRVDALLVKPGDPGELASAIETVTTNTEVRKTLIKNGYESAREAAFENLGLRFLKEIEAVAKADSLGEQLAQN